MSLTSASATMNLNFHRPSEAAATLVTVVTVVTAVVPTVAPTVVATLVALQLFPLPNTNAMQPQVQQVATGKLPVRVRAQTQFQMVKIHLIGPEKSALITLLHTLANGMALNHARQKLTNAETLDPRANAVHL